MDKFINKYLKLILIIGIFINLLIIFLFEPACPWKTNFNIDCAGCGTTRMIKALLSLNFYQAFRFNPLMFSLLIIGIIYLGYVLICKLKRKNYYKIKDKDLIILLVCVILFTILRNIPGIEYLKPTIIN